MPDQCRCFTPASPHFWLPTRDKPFEVHRLPFPDPRHSHPGIVGAPSVLLIGTCVVEGILTADISCRAFVQMCLLDDGDADGEDSVTVLEDSYRLMKLDEP